MGLASRLREILEDQVLVSHEKGVAKLEEPGQMEVKIIEVPEDSTVVHLNKMGPWGGLKPRVCARRSDYLVVNGEREMDRAVFVELKKTLNNLSDGMDQLRQSRPLLDYLHSVSRVYFGVNSAKQEVIVRYCMIGEKFSPRFNKEPTRVSRPKIVETYQDITAAVIVGNVVRFDELWSGG